MVMTDAEKLAQIEAAAVKAAAAKDVKANADRAASALLRKVWNGYADATDKDSLSGLKGAARTMAVRSAGYSAFVEGVECGLWSKDAAKTGLVNPECAGGSVWIAGAGLGGKGETLNPARALVALLVDGKSSGFVGKRAS